MAQRSELILSFLMALALGSPSAHALTPWSNSEASSVSADESLASVLAEQKLTWGEIRSIESKKNAVLAQIDGVLKEKNDSIFSYQRLVEQLEAKLRKQELSFKEKIVGEYEKRELASIVEGKEQTISALQGQISKLDLQVEAMKKQFARQETLFRYQLTVVKKEYQKAFEKISSGDTELPEGMAMKLTSYQMQLDKLLDNGLDTYSNDSSPELEKRLEAQESTLAKILETNRDLVMELRKVESENAKLKGEVSDLHTEVIAARQESANWQRVASELENNLIKTQKRLRIAEVDFAGQKANLEARIADYQKQSILTPGRAPASAPEGKQGTIMKAYEGVTQKLASAHFDWAPQLEAGMISFRVKESFYFNKDSFVLTEMSKDRLHILMEIYAQEIFGNEELRGMIDSIEFVGHSSPWFQGQIIDPGVKYPEAFDYNMKLSLDRAREVVHYVFDGDFIEFPYKEDFRAKVKVSGQGHAAPLVLRMPASESSQKSCAPFDCERSRRLEIVVHFQAH